MNMNVMIEERPELPLTPPTPATSPTPPTPPSSPRPTSSLSAEINAATREQHVTLNRLIADLLPKALPPQTQNATALVRGLIPFAKIFVSFERAWSQIPLTDYTFGSNNHHRPELLYSLRTLRPEGLVRSRRLTEDLKFTKLPCRPVPFDVKTPSDFDIQQQSRGVDNAKLIEKPHLLLAYAWVMYMAVFSGGRWIRSQLSSATKVKEDFWLHEDTVVETEKGKPERDRICGMSFLSFPEGTRDGEDIKQVFKARLAATETFLTDEERREVVEAAIELFTFCITEVRRMEQEEKELVKKLMHSLLEIAFLSLAYVFGLWCLYKGVVFLFLPAVNPERRTTSI